MVSVHQDTVIPLDELTGSEGFPEGDKHVFVGVSVIVTNEFLDSLSGLSCVVEWDSGDVMVQDVGLDDVVEEEPTDETKFSVDSCTCTSGEVPFVVFVMRQGDVSMLQVGEEDDPVVYQEVRNEPVDHAVEPAEMLDPLVDGIADCQDTDI